MQTNKNASDDWCRDPITLCTLEDPYVASDGYTYCLPSLLRAVGADPWRRSPVTGEVLRPDAYRNDLARRLLGLPSPPTPPSASATCVQLYDAASDPLPANGCKVTFTAADLPSPAATMTRMRWQLADRFSWTAHVWFDSAGLAWLMHPPAAHEMRDDVVALLRATSSGCIAVQNPHCFTQARLDNGRTVEEQWLHAFAPDI